MRGDGIYTLKINDTNPPNNISMDMILPNSANDFFGSLAYTAQLSSLSNNQTRYVYTYTSSKTPKFLATKLMAMLGKVIISFSLMRLNKRFISYVKTTNI